MSAAVAEFDDLGGELGGVVAGVETFAEVGFVWVEQAGARAGFAQQLFDRGGFGEAADRFTIQPEAAADRRDRLPLCAEVLDGCVAFAGADGQAIFRQLGCCGTASGVIGGDGLLIVVGFWLGQLTAMTGDRGFDRAGQVMPQGLVSRGRGSCTAGPFPTAPSPNPVCGFHRDGLSGDDDVGIGLG